MTSRRSNNVEAKSKILLSLLNRRAKIASQPLFGDIKDTSPSRGQVKTPPHPEGKLSLRVIQGHISQLLIKYSITKSPVRDKK